MRPVIFGTFQHHRSITFSVKSQIVNILGFVSQEAKWRTVGRYLYNTKTDFHKKIFCEIEYISFLLIKRG